MVGRTTSMTEFESVFRFDETINYIPLIGGRVLEMTFLITKRVVMINVFGIFHFQTYIHGLL
jgi:hypothetical protein